jgi:hypothetical protein
LRVASGASVSQGQSQQIEFSGPGDGLGAPLDTQLSIDIGDVFLDRTQGQNQFGGSLPVREAGGDRSQYLHFTPGEGLDEGSRLGRSPFQLGLKGLQQVCDKGGVHALSEMGLRFEQQCSEGRPFV